MTTKIVQQHMVEGRREFELVGDLIEYRVESASGEEGLSVVLSVLDPEPVIEGSMMQFVSEVNREALVKLVIDSPDPDTFQAFVSTLKQRISEEAFGRLAARNRESAITAEQVETTIEMLETYLDPAPIAGLLDALRELRGQLDDQERLTRVAEAFNGLGAQKGSVLTYAPFFMTMLSSTDLGDPD